MKALTVLFLFLFSSAAFPAEETVFFPSLPETPRLQFLKSYSTRRDVGASENFLARLLFGSRGTEDLFVRPSGIAVHGSRVYVCDTGAGEVRVLDLAGGRTGTLSGRGVRLRKPVHIAVDGEGHKYVADAGLARVVVFDAADAYLRSYRDPAGWKPTGVALSTGSFYVVDNDAHQVKEVNPDTGAVVRLIGRRGSGEGELFMPTSLALDPSGVLFVSDTLNFRVQKFSPEGRSLGSIGRAGRVPGAFARPRGVALDPAGRLYVADAAFDNVQIFDREGRVLLFFGGTGEGPGQMNMPAGVAVDADPENLRRFQPMADPRLTLEYLVWVASQYGPRRVSVYGFGTWREGP